MVKEKCIFGSGSVRAALRLSLFQSKDLNMWRNLSERLRESDRSNDFRLLISIKTRCEVESSFFSLVSCHQDGMDHSF